MMTYDQIKNIISQEGKLFKCVIKGYSLQNQYGEDLEIDQMQGDRLIHEGLVTNESRPSKGVILYMKNRLREI